MDKESYNMKLVREFKEKTAKDLLIKKMYLFGSRAKGYAGRWSDFDLMIISKDFKALPFRYRASKMYLYWDYNYPVDFICYTPDEFRRLKNTSVLIQEALAEGIEI